MKIRCDGCHKVSDNVRLREKTRADFTVERVRMCTPCARRHGYCDVTFDRGYYAALGAVTQ